MPDLVHLLPSKPEWYDRNAISRFLTTVLLQQPGPESGVFWAYTVPTNKKAWLDWLVVAIMRQAVSAAPAYSYVSVDLFDPTPVIAYPVIQAMVNSNVVGVSAFQQLAGAGMIPAGYALRGSVQTDGGGAQWWRNANAKVTEFDAY